MKISVTPASQFSCLQELEEELHKVPSNDLVSAEGSMPVQYGTKFETFKNDLSFNDDDRNYLFMEGWISQHPTELDQMAFKNFIDNFQAPFGVHPTFLQVWPTADDSIVDATFLRLLVFLRDGRLSDLRAPLVSAFRDHVANGSIRIESLSTPLRPLSMKAEMKQRILIPTENYKSWKQFLKEPDTHFAEGYSAMSAAIVWESAKRRPSGFPVNIENVLTEGGLARQGIKLLLAIPERKTLLSGSGYPSHTDVFCLARNGISELVSIAVEAKVDEPFDKFLVGEWLAKGEENSDGGKNRLARLKFLCDMLTLDIEIH